MAFSRRHSCSGRGVPFAEKSVSQFNALHRRSDAQDLTDTRTQTTVDYLECALKDFQSQVTALRAEALPQTQLLTKPDLTELLAFFDSRGTTAVVEPGVAESVSTEARASEHPSAAVHGDTTISEFAEQQMFQT